MQRSSLPPITTHNVVNDGEDPVLRSLRRCHLFNDKSDRVKVSYRPGWGQGYGQPPGGVGSGSRESTLEVRSLCFGPGFDGSIVSL